MATITINKKVFEKEIGKFDEEMQERIAMFGTPIEAIEDKEFQLEIFPNRPDMLSYSGFKRSFLAFLGKKTGLRKYNLKKPEKNYRVVVDKSVGGVRPFTVCAIVKKLKFDDEKIKELIEIQEKLHATIGRRRKKIAIGVYPLEKISLPIKYEALEPDKIKFTPLESSREMSGLEILQKHSAGKEYAHLLAGKQKFPIFIDSKNQILSMPPIINSEFTGRVTTKTKEIFVECSGADFESLQKCLNILVTTLVEMGGEIYQMRVEYSKKEITPNLEATKKEISLDNTNKLLGLELDKKNLKKLLERMGYFYKNGEVLIPCYRTDVLHEVDLIEDVAIAYGYENFESVVPEIATIGEVDSKEKLKNKFAQVLCGLSLLEVSNYHLSRKTDQFEKMGIAQKDVRDMIEVESSKTDYTILRNNLSHYLLKNLAENIDCEYPQKIFEIGRVFELKEKIEEEENLAIAIAPGNFTELKQIVEYFFSSIGISIKIKETENCPGHLIEGRTAGIYLGEKEIGSFGEVHPKILKNWKIKMPVALLEICLKEVFEEF